jgi:hypothetical protein
VVGVGRLVAIAGMCLEKGLEGLTKSPNTCLWEDFAGQDLLEKLWRNTKQV